MMDTGAVYSFGCSDPNQWWLKLKLVAALQGKRAVQVSAGEEHSLVLVEQGEVYSFGCGED